MIIITEAENNSNKVFGSGLICGMSVCIFFLLILIKSGKFFCSLSRSNFYNNITLLHYLPKIPNPNLCRQSESNTSGYFYLH